MIVYPVINALKSKLFDQVIVSTEDAEIAEIGKQAGARVIQRPERLAQDHSTVVEVCENVLKTLEKEKNFPDRFCCIYPTAIFISIQDVLDSYKLLIKAPIPDVVMGVSDFNILPVQALEENHGFLRYKWSEYKGMQSQLHPKLVASNGTLYWARSKRFLGEKTFYTERLIGYEMPWVKAVDIDTPEDFKIAQMLAANLLFKEVDQ